MKNCHRSVNAVVEKANEVSLFVIDKQVLALLDTGSMVSTMASSRCSLLNLSIQPLDKVFRIKGAGGHDIPYLGIVEAAIRCPKVDMASVPVLLLVVPDTEYHSRVPVLLGTNILSLMKGKVPAEEFAWRNTFAMLARHQAVVENSSCLGVMISTKPLTIPAHGRVIFHGQTRVKAVCQKLTVCLDGASGLPKGVIATPRVNCISPGQARSKLPVELVYHLSQDVTIPAKAWICDLYNTEDVDLIEENEGGGVSCIVSSGSDADFLKNFMHMKDQLPVEQVEEMQ